MFNQDPSPTDGAEAPDRRQQILDAALTVMAERGFRGASIKRIAEQADLRSPALIYWYFKDKDALFAALLGRLAPFLDELTDPVPLLDHPPEEVLTLVAERFLAAIQQPAVGRLVRLLLAEATRHPAVGAFFASRGPLVVLGFLERYLSHQVELGRLRPHDPRGGARAFMGMLVVYALGREVLPSIGAGFPPADRYGRDVVAIFLDGMRPSGRAAAGVE